MIELSKDFIHDLEETYDLVQSLCGTETGRTCANDENIHFPNKVGQLEIWYVLVGRCLLTRQTLC